MKTEFQDFYVMGQEKGRMTKLSENHILYFLRLLSITAPKQTSEDKVEI